MIEPRVRDADFTLYVGDARVDCCMTSPPYWGQRDYGVEGQLGAEATPSEYVETLVGVFDEVQRVLAPTGTLWLNIGDTYSAGGGFWPGSPSNQARLRGESVGALRGASGERYMARATGGRKAPEGLKPKNLVGIPWRVALALQGAGWYLRSEVIWSKTFCMPEKVTDRPGREHEQVFLLTKEPRYYYKHDGGRTVWEIAPQPAAGAHFAVFPEKLVERCLDAGCPDGGVVLDPFIGSGTTAVVARRTGRRCIGVELNPEHADLIVERTSQLSLG